MLKIKGIPILLVALILLSCCNGSFPNKYPDLGSINDQLEFNKYIKIIASKSCNSFKSGEVVCLEIENLSEKEWSFSTTDDLHIYMVENKEWKKVADNLAQLGDDVYLLQPYGIFPGDRHIVILKPHVQPNKSHFLRIIILVHEIVDNKSEQTTGAFVDLTLMK